MAEVSEPILKIEGLTKVYSGPRGPSVKALDTVDLEIRKGEIFALLGPNGAVCGLVRPTSGTMAAFGHDLASDWRAARARIGLVPQELSTDMFETVWRAVSYSRGLFGHPPDKGRIEEILKSLSLWEKKDSQIRELSGVTLAQDTQCCVYPNLTHNAIQRGTVDIVLDEIELPQAISSIMAG